MTRQETLSVPVVLAYALAAAGGVVGYIPLLTLLLPIKVDGIDGGDRYGLLAWCSVAGALAGGPANIAFGWLGDRSVARGGGRRGWLLGGAAATMLSFAAIAVVRQPAAIVAAMIAFQIAINAVLAQVGALIAEEIPATQKGTTAALLTLGNPIAAGASAIVLAAAAGEGARLALVALLMTGALLPLLLVRSPIVPRSPTRGTMRVAMRRDLVMAGVARLLVQIASSGVGLYLFFYFDALLGPGSGTPGIVARLLVVATIVPVPAALVLGRWSDRIGRRKPFLAGAALLATLGLVGMALARSWPPGAIAYVAFATGIAIFQALNTGHAMLLLPDDAHSGRNLGILNLANILPQVIAPLFVWWSAAVRDFGTALLALALVTLLAGLLPLAIGARD